MAEIWTTDRILSRLSELAEEGFRDKYAHFGIEVKSALGVRSPKVKALAKEMGKSEPLALELWRSDIHEMKHLAIHLMPPDALTDPMVRKWTTDIYSWDLCDSACLHLFRRAPFAHAISFELAEQQGLYIRRVGLVLMTALTVHNKRIPQSHIDAYLDVANRLADDDRHMVKKAVSWLLRQIGKSKLERLEQVLPMANSFGGSDRRSRRWIGKDVLRDLQKGQVRERLENKKARR